MSRQERLARRAKLAAKRAGQTVNEATERVTASRPSSHPQEDPVAECKRLRDGGMPWWEVGQKLGLAGPARSSAEPEGKRGAAAARKLYAQASGGVVPRTLAPRKGTVPKPQGPGQTGTITERKIQLVTKGHVIPPDMSDDDLEELLAGKKIQWAIDLRALCDGKGEPEWCEMEATVHPDWVRVEDKPDKYGNRTIRFRELLGRDDRGRLMSGPTRTVRVNAIYTIR